MTLAEYIRTHREPGGGRFTRALDRARMLGRWDEREYFAVQKSFRAGGLHLARASTVIAIRELVDEWLAHRIRTTATIPTGFAPMLAPDVISTRLLDYLRARLDDAYTGPIYVVREVPDA